MRGLIDRAWLRSSQHKDKVAFTDHVDIVDELRDFAGRLVRRAAKMGIPLHLEGGRMDVAFIVHSRRKRDLRPMEWEVIGHLGTEISQQYQLNVSWMGAPMGACWLWSPPAASSAN